MRFCSFFTRMLLSIGVASVTLAQPLDGVNEFKEHPVIFDTRAPNLKIAAEPSKDFHCPKREKSGGFGPYDAHTYSKNQIKAAFIEGAKLAAKGKQLGKEKYPHVYGNKEKLPFACGKDKMEFPISTDNKVYNGESSADIPDRVVFEYQEKKGDYIVKFCGVMRHGPQKPFLSCN